VTGPGTEAEKKAVAMEMIPNSTTETQIVGLRTVD